MGRRLLPRGKIFAMPRGFRSFGTCGNQRSACDGKSNYGRVCDLGRVNASPLCEKFHKRPTKPLKWQVSRALRGAHFLKFHRVKQEEKCGCRRDISQSGKFPTYQGVEHRECCHREGLRTMACFRTPPLIAVVFPLQRDRHTSAFLSQSQPSVARRPPSFPPCSRTSKRSRRYTKIIR